jgi:adenosylhomocysteine nucleosidase
LTRIGIVTGLAREAKHWRGSNALVRCHGPGPSNARHAAESLIAEGVDVLMSFGVAGALDPKLQPGDIIVATEVISPDGTRYPAEAGTSGIAGTLATSAEPVTSAAEKRLLFERTGAIAVDMESAAVADVARAAGARFMAVRAIADPADHSLPRAAIAALRPDGNVNYLALLARPWDWGGLLALAADMRRADRALREAARRFVL